MQKQYTLEHEIRLLDEQKAVKQKELEKLREKQKKYEAYKATTYIGAKFIIVSFEQKDIAKKMGAMWCPYKKCWYVPAKLDLEPFLKRWKAIPSKPRSDCKHCGEWLYCGKKDNPCQLRITGCEYTKRGECCPYYGISEECAVYIRELSAPPRASPAPPPTAPSDPVQSQ
jgi:hypothetical protein